MSKLSPGPQGRRRGSSRQKDRRHEHGRLGCAQTPIRRWVAVPRKTRAPSDPAQSGSCTVPGAQLQRSGEGKRFPVSP